jgi:hypothetical protein
LKGEFVFSMDKRIKFNNSPQDVYFRLPCSPLGNAREDFVELFQEANVPFAPEC